MGLERDVKKSDVYLPKSRKSIEVKTTNHDFAGDAEFAWQFTENEGKNLPFDYVVLFGFDDQEALSTEKVFLACKSNLGKLDHGEFDTGYGISYFANPAIALETQDKELSKNAGKYESNWSVFALDCA